MAKYNYYAINKGFDSEKQEEVNNKIFTSWDECKKYTKGVNEARFKGFLTLSEAKEWLKQFNDDKDNNVTVNIKTNDNKFKLNNHHISIIDDEFEIICNSIGVNPYDVLKTLKKQFIETCNFLIDKN